MKWVLYVVGAFALLVLAIALVGMMLPRDHVASRTARFRKPAAEVFELVSGSQDWRPGSKEDPPSVVVESMAPVRHVTRISDPSLPFGGTWTWEIQQLPDGCEATVTEAGFVTNPVFRFVSRFVMGHHATMDTYLKHLKAKLGE